MKRGAATTHPIRQPSMAYALVKANRLNVRSAMPGSEAMLMC